MARTRRTLRSHWRPRRVPLAWWGRSEKATAVIIGIPGSSLVLGGNHHIPPSRSEPHCLSGNDFFCHLETAHMWTQSPRYPCRGASGQPGQCRLSRAPPGLRPQEKRALAGAPVHPSSLGPHIFPPLGPRDLSGRPLSTCGVQALGQRVGSWSEGHRSPHSCDSVTSLTLVRILMTICELSLECSYVFVT